MTHVSGGSRASCRTFEFGRLIVPFGYVAYNVNLAKIYGPKLTRSDGRMFDGFIGCWEINRTINLEICFCGWFQVGGVRYRCCVDIYWM